MGFHERMEGWEAYPLTVQNRPYVDDVHYWQETLRQKALVLFVQQPEKTELVLLSCSAPAANTNEGDQTTVETIIKTVISLKQNLEKIHSNVQDKFFFISQANSWSRLKITTDMFSILCHFYAVSPAYLELVTELGFKTSDIDEPSGTSFCRFHPGTDTHRIERFEISYNIWFIEEHGRSELREPWSLRCFVVYQHYFFREHCSTWILIQHPKSLCGYLKRTISNYQHPVIGSRNKSLHPMALHISLLTSSQRNWKSYIKYLNEQLTQMVEIACFSKIGRHGPRDYALDFSNCQSLESLRMKIRRAILILDIALRTADNTLQQSRKVVRYHSYLFGFPSQTELEFDLQQYIDAIKDHKQRVEMLLDSANSIKLILFKILDYRNDKVVNENGSSLKELASRASAEATSALSLTQLARNDSRSMKVVSVVALMYLPASFVATIFSSSLVANPLQNANSSKSELQHGIGLFMGITIALTSITIAITFAWDRYFRTLIPFHHPD